MSDEEKPGFEEFLRAVCWRWDETPEEDKSIYRDIWRGKFGLVRAAVLSSAAQAIREAKAEALIEAADEMQRLLDEWEATKLVGARHELGTILATKQDIKFLRDRAGGL